MQSIQFILMWICMSFLCMEVTSSEGETSSPVNDILEKILGYSYFQNYYDTLNFRQKTLNGSQLINKIANNFGMKYFDRITAVERLEETVKKSITTENYIKECCKMLSENLEMDNTFNQPIGKVACHRISDLASHPPMYLSKEFERTSAENLASLPSLTWQYFSSETGVTTLYPAVKFDDCRSYDARFRPFYVQANVPEPKDVVVVIDVSGSMDKPHNGQMIIDIAKKAAQTVMNTLNPHDMVGVLAFSTEIKVVKTANEGDECFKDELAKATSPNIEIINQFIDEMRHGGSTFYGLALEKAFDYFENSKSDGKRDRVILFLSDGEPTDRFSIEESGNYIFNLLKTRNKKLNNSVILMTYGLGSNIDFKILRDMASQDGSLYGVSKDDHENIKTGLFTRVADPSNLRKEMASYYNFFSKRSPTSQVIWSLPYLDKWGMGILMSATKPIYDEADHVLGVVGTDITMEDLLSGAIYFRPTRMSYVFIIDASGYVIHHPLFEYPKDHQVKYIDMNAFETDPAMRNVIEDMKKGGTGSATFVNRRIFPDGASKLYGVQEISVLSDVHWKKIPHTKFSVCIVLAKDETESTLRPIQPTEDDEFLYHRIDIVAPENPCMHYNNYAARNQSSVSLGPRAFASADHYLDNTETENDVNLVTKYIISGKGGSFLKPGVRDSVWATNAMEKYWQENSNSDLERFIIWRYVGTKDGILRIYPGTILPKNFDSTQRPWYQNAVANKGKAAFSTPYRDAGSGDLIISISKAVFEGRKSHEHNYIKDEVVAVMSADILVPYFRSLLDEIYPDCALSDTYRCTLIDSAGFVITHDDEKRFSSEYPSHVTEVEPRVAESLILNNIMVPEECILMNEVKVQRTYKIVEKETFTGMSNDDCFQFRLIAIPSTNALLIIRNIGSYCGNEDSPCICAGYSFGSRRCITDSTVCECPCSAIYEDFNTCRNQFNITGKEKNLKPCSPESKTLYDIPKKEEDFSHLPQCTRFSTPTVIISNGLLPSDIGAIVGGCVAGVVVMIIIIAVVIILLKRAEDDPIYGNANDAGPARNGSCTNNPLPPVPGDGVYVNAMLTNNTVV